jgi:hypothetical protein
MVGAKLSAAGVADMLENSKEEKLKPGGYKGWSAPSYKYVSSMSIVLATPAQCDELAHRRGTCLKILRSLNQYKANDPERGVEC